MTARYALIRYMAPDGTPCVGSGMLVRERTVLTADHIADGTEYQVECGNGTFGVERFVRSGTREVDLAVLILAQPGDGAQIPDVTPMGYACVDRGHPDEITGCVAVGFPLWRRDSRGHVTAQVKGLIRTAEGVHVPLGGTDGEPRGTDGEWLTLEGDREPGDPGHPLPTGELAGSPWGGMSGAVVVWQDMVIGQDVVIGVVRSHNPARGPGSLAVTPLTALRWLPEGKQREFCRALGIDRIERIRAIPGAASVRDRYASALARVGLEVPDRWDEAALDELRRSHHARDATADLLEALCVALGAVSVFEQVGGHEIGFKKLVHLYRRHVGRWPDAATREDMLIQAASAGIREWREAESDAGYRPEPLTALARFLLGVAGHWHVANHPGMGVTLDDPRLSELADWLTGPHGQQRDDVADYLKTKTGRRTWALIELSAPEFPGQDWPDAIVVRTVTASGPGQPHRRPCKPTEAGVLKALRDIVNNELPEGDVIVDLVMPRHLLEAGVEHWNVVRVGGRHERLARNYYKPQLRWAMHLNDPRLRERLWQRSGDVDWLAAPEAIPASVTASPGGFKNWLDAREKSGTKHPPYFIASHGRADDHDPLGLLLWEGYGFVVWFGPGMSAEAMWHAQEAAAELSAHQRRNELPQHLTDELWAHRPVVIWSDPEGREGFPLPDPTGGGTRRGGT